MVGHLDKIKPHLNSPATPKMLLQAPIFLRFGAFWWSFSDIFDFLKQPKDAFWSQDSNGTEILSIRLTVWQ